MSKTPEELQRNLDWCLKHQPSNRVAIDALRRSLGVGKIVQDPRMMELYWKVKEEYPKALKRARTRRPTLYDVASMVGVSTGPNHSMDCAERLVTDLTRFGLVEFVQEGGRVSVRFLT